MNHDSDITVTDGFCGAGGSSIGLVASGMRLVIAANHWERAIETHSTNFPAADHLCADLSNYDMRRLPRTMVAWFSPECTWHSPAGGRKRARAQLDMFDDYVPNAAGDRSRMTMTDVIRATEAHRYRQVVVENVVEVAEWELFDWWLDGMVRLGYSYQIVCVSSAHIWGTDNLPAPQWRDRLYIVFTADGVPRPDVTPRPLAWCTGCEQDVEAVQVWKRADRRLIGKYGLQYTYRCPLRACRHQAVEPYVLPASVAIDWADLGSRIGDRAKPLAPATMRRIEAGLAMFAQPVIAAGAGNTFERPGYHRVWPADGSPLMARTGTTSDGVAVPPFLMHVNKEGGRHHLVDRTPLNPVTTKIGEGLVTAEPFITMLRSHADARSIEDALDTIAAGGNHHALTVPPDAFLSKHHGGLDYAQIEHMNKSVTDPMPSIVSRPNVSLVIPYRRRALPRTTAEPLHTLSTVDSAALCSIDVPVEDCHFRMLKPREHLRGQRFPDTYEVRGNLGEQTMQAGNAVSSNVAQWIGTAIVEALS